MLISKDFLQIEDHKSKNWKNKQLWVFFNWELFWILTGPCVAVHMYDCVRCTRMLEFSHLKFIFSPVLLSAVLSLSSLVLFLKVTVCSFVSLTPCISLRCYKIPHHFKISNIRTFPKCTIFQCGAAKAVVFRKALK